MKSAKNFIKSRPNSNFFTVSMNNNEIYHVIAMTQECIELKESDFKKIKAFMHKCPLAVISTIDQFSNSPQSALIAFSENDKLELYFMTFADSRKYGNLQKDPYVSLLVGFGYTTIQYEGKTSELGGEKAQEALYAFSIKETPCTQEFLNNPRARFFKVFPKWIRYSDYNICPAEIVENQFFGNHGEIK